MSTIGKFNLIIIATFLLSLVLMNILFSYFYAEMGLHGYVFTSLSDFFLVNMFSIAAIFVVFSGIVFEAKKMLAKTNDPQYERALKFLLLHGSFALSSIPFLFVFSCPLLTSSETSYHIDLLGINFFPYSASLGALALISFISNMYLYLFIKSVSTPKIDFERLQKRVLVLFFVFVVISVNPLNYYALVPPSGSLSLRPLTTLVLFLSLLYVGSYGIISFSNSYRLVRSQRMVIRLKLFVFGLIVYIFAFLPQVIWALFFKDESLFIMDYLTVTLVAVAEFFIYVSIKE